MNIIVSTTLNNGIGKDNKLLFNLKQDMRNFKKLTTGKIVVMGRNTFESLPNKQPLENRINIVMSRNKIENENVITVNDLNSLLNELEKYNTEDIFIIGGEAIYKALLPVCKTIYKTEIFARKPADTFFYFDEKDFTLIKESDIIEEQNIKFQFKEYSNNTKCMQCANPKMILKCSKCKIVKSCGNIPIPQVDIGEIWINNKKGTKYKVVSVENNQTNCRDDEVMVMYQNEEGRIFPRNIFDFVSKFKKEC